MLRINVVLVSESSSLMFTWPHYSQAVKRAMWAQGPWNQLCFSPDQFAHLFALHDLLKAHCPQYSLLLAGKGFQISRKTFSHQNTEEELKGSTSENGRRQSIKSNLII